VAARRGSTPLAPTNPFKTIMKPKYVICPGYVTSKTDGQRHYIGAMQLIRLYQVDPKECEIYEPAPWWPRSYYRMIEEHQQELIRLEPRFNGNYDLPNNVHNQLI
jgi:hypothetical protein